MTWRGLGLIRRLPVLMPLVFSPICHVPRQSYGGPRRVEEEEEEGETAPPQSCRCMRTMLTRTDDRGSPGHCLMILGERETERVGHTRIKQQEAYIVTLSEDVTDRREGELDWEPKTKGAVQQSGDSRARSPMHRKVAGGA